MNSELFSWGTRVPVSTALRGKPGLELSNEIQDSLSEVKWNMFGLEFFLVFITSKAFSMNFLPY